MKTKPIIIDGIFKGVSIEVLADVSKDEDGEFSIKALSYDDGETWTEPYPIHTIKNSTTYVSGGNNENLLFKKYDTKEVIKFYENK